MEAASVLREDERPDVRALRDKAAAARAEAEALRARVVELRADAIRLDREADELATRPMQVPTPRELLAEEIGVWIRRQRTGKKISVIAEHFGVTPARARAALEMLMQDGSVVRVGLKRGTEYRKRREGEEIELPQPFAQRWHERIRDAARKLETFDMDDIRAELPGLADATLYRWLRQLEEDGVLEVERVGTAKLYAYVAPVATVTPIRTHAREGTIVRRRGSVSVEGTGKRKLGGTRRESREMVAAALAQGAEIRIAKHGASIIVGGRIVQSIPKTPSDHRSMKNARATLKRHGIET